MDRRRGAAYAVIVVFMVVTVGHVAAFTGSMEPEGWWVGGLGEVVYHLLLACGVGWGGGDYERERIDSGAQAVARLSDCGPFAIGQLDI